MILVQVDGRSVLYGFGSNKFGQLGVGKAVTVSAEPSLVKVSNVSKVACSKNSTFAIND
jgi:alpha-tubulin suppressor-like RCC1 family protein